MTRIEEIRQYLKERNIPITSLEANSIIEGIKWADEHPKEGLISIDKACEYLESATKLYLGYGTTSDFVDTFRKVMKG